MRYEILLTQTDYDSLTLHFSSDMEEVALMLAGVNEDQQRIRLLINQIYKVPKDLFLVQQEDRFVLDSLAFRHIFKEARKQGLSVVIAHNHPGIVLSQPARFSEADLQGELRLLEDFARLTSQPHGAIVFGKNGSVDCRVWVNGKHYPVDNVRVIGKQVTNIFPTSSNRETLNIPENLQRQVLAFGELGQQVLAETKVAVVGGGGTGSFIATELAYLGVKDITILDFDKVEATNLNRLFGASLHNIGEYKVDVLKRFILSIGNGTSVNAVKGSLLTYDGIDAVRKADIVFSCTDTVSSRAVLNQIAHQYFIPVIDMGVGLDSKDGYITGGGGYAKVILPDGTCLQCNEDLPPHMLAQEQLPVEQLHQAIRNGYCKEVQNPSVISLNGTISSLAVTLFINLLFGFMKINREEYLNYSIIKGNIKTAVSAGTLGCYICKDVKGRGHKLELFQI